MSMAKLLGEKNSKDREKSISFQFPPFLFSLQTDGWEDIDDSAILLCATKLNVLNEYANHVDSQN